MKIDRRTLVDHTRPIVERRAGGVCECGCGGVLNPAGFHTVPEWDEFWGRGAIAEPVGLAKPERIKPTVQNTWMLTRLCHQRKTARQPTRAAWLEKFRAHCIRHGYWDEAAKAGKELEAA